MQLIEVPQFITETYLSLTESTECKDIEKYMLREEVLHDDFWRLHHSFKLAKYDLRVTLNKVSEAAENVAASIQAIRNLIVIDRQNRKQIKKEERMMSKEERAKETGSDISTPNSAIKKHKQE